MSSIVFYEKQVTRAKALLVQREKCKWDVVRIAFEICDIQRGAHRGANLRTITKFANDIGMHPKTLTDWINDYRGIILKMNVDIEKMPDAERSTFSGAVRRTRLVLGMDATRAQVKKIFDEEYGARTCHDRQWHYHTRSIKNLREMIVNGNYKAVNSRRVESFLEEFMTLSESVALIER